VVEHFPKRGTNGIWNRGANVGEVLKTFMQEQRQVLKVWSEDMTAQVKEFLAKKFPGHDMTRIADCFMSISTARFRKNRPKHTGKIKIAG
jgi:hypothetical protein